MNHFTDCHQHYIQFRVAICYNQATYTQPPGWTVPRC